MGQVWLGVNRFETEKGVWTVVRVDGDSYSLKDQIKAFGAFRYGYPFDLFVAMKQESGLDSDNEFRKWMDRNGDKREKRWSTHFAGAPEMNADKVRELAEEVGQACGLPPFDVRENQPVVLGKAEPAKPAEPEEPEGWTDPDTDPDLPF